MDPRQRLFLEEAWHTLEDAGYMGERIRGARCGVYVGVEEGEYASLGGDGQVTNTQNAMLPARIAYFLDLKGPNFALTAACSSGLVAVHQACQALRQGDCDLALAGGASLIISPLIYTALGKLNLLSPDGHCYAFDQRANGMVIGEAVAAVLLETPGQGHCRWRPHLRVHHGQWCQLQRQDQRYYCARSSQPGRADPANLH